MFKKKQVEHANIDTKHVVSSNELEPYKQPMVFLFDAEEAVVETLKELRFNSFEGSFGSIIKVNNKNHEEKFLKLNHDYPANLHEFDIVMLDLTKNKSETYDPSQHQLINTSGNTAHALLSAYPEQIFDPRPLAINMVSKDLNDLFEKKSVIIVFCGSEHISEYQFVEITSRGVSITGREKLSSFRFYQNLPGYKSRSGRKVKLPEKDSKLSPLFRKHLDSIDFETTFYHPTVWRDNKNQLSDNFAPLLLNERDEIVSYAHFIEKSIVFVFPDIADKPNFVSELFKTYLPEIVPEIFPFHGEFQWLDDGNYPLPGEKQLLRDRAVIEEKYNKDIAENENALVSLKDRYKFLSDLISETGGALVSAVEIYLKWLGFESVVNLDDTDPDILEEDIQIDCEDRFLVIEIKGIGGTSTDKDCSQVSKIKYRRAEERDKFDVFGLYIVNHQRYMPPKSRSNPPFTENQIKDAGHDKRGLLTTYDLYKAYFMIEEGILQKEDVRESLFKTGLITLEPENISSIGTPHELFMDGQVAILNLNSITLAVGDTLIVRKNGDYSKAIIESLQVDDKEVDTCNTGEIGIKLDRKLKKNSELFVRKV
ncbi:hypothetical protein G8770_15215 [Aestuariicella hydrocarbonica]|uniref:Uncharacterized protein n=1 Tax=Pseudomaricurvus hydrocarbonicus TaxID=1470433 RepID=A0A9E5JYB8_9GAMM|nr:hypothetical protein [Aestuariicella hydrocarbonica]NHO66900.1 hypothetical protein [Aestuariicella hydrocarbonica]